LPSVSTDRPSSIAMSSVSPEPAENLKAVPCMPNVRLRNDIMFGRG
jgi:hypothetical protein